MSTAAQLSPVQTARFERLLPGPIERVWDYLTQPDLRRTWLAESAGDICSVTESQPLRSMEYSMRDASVVSLELESRGSDVLLVLTHRRVPEWIAGAGTVLAVALLVFSICRPGEALRKPQNLGPAIVAHAPGLNSLHLRGGHFTLC
ncbi:MAG TPA: hypothetical protein VGG72_10525 [Bryobacteraceae bacterium]|jgi:hypothetical protein